MLAKLPLRSKLVLVVSVPLFVILGFATFGIAGRMSDLDAQRQYGRLRGPNDALAAVATGLENEGVLSTWKVAAGDDPAAVGRLTRARAVTDRAVTLLDSSGEALATGNVGPGTIDSWRTLVGRLGHLDQIRAQVDDRAASPTAFGTTYTDLADNTLGVAELVARDLQERSLSTSMLGLLDLRREQLESAHEAGVVLPYLVTGKPDEFNGWIAAITTQDSYSAKFEASATSAERSALATVRAAAAPEDPVRPDTAAALPSEFPKVDVAPTAYYAAWHDKQDYLNRGIAAVQGVIDHTASDLESSALNGVLLYGLGVSGLVLFVLVLAWMVVRSVNKPLRALTAAARDVAEVRLPALVETLEQGGELTQRHIEELTPIHVASKDEIGELATAFTTIQQVTAHVAEQQAALLRKGIGDLYVNLARRNQSLLDRQISLLDEMESQADDSDQLGALFELDHLATRMRRNAESLLVMSGAEQPRQWSESIPILDVVRASTAEITDFARVSYSGFDGEVAIAGNAVADVTHLLAELLENATTFSPPGTPVVVTGMRAERRFVISVTDEGIGMTDERLLAANSLLARPPATGLALSRTLGLHVVGHLAVRYGIVVQLRRGANGGVTAVVALPAKVLSRLGKPRESSEHDAGRPAPPERTVAEPVVEHDGPVVDEHAAPAVARPLTPRPGPPRPADPETRPAEPWVAEPWSAEPMRSHPATNEPATNEPAAPAPAASAPAASAPAAPEPVRPEPVVVAGATPDPRVDPVRADADAAITWQPDPSGSSNGRDRGTGEVPPPPPRRAHPAGTDRPVPPPPAPPVRADDVGDGLSRRVPGAAFTASADTTPANDGFPVDDDLSLADDTAILDDAPIVDAPPEPVGSLPGLAQRSPGHHLSHKPPAPAPPNLDGEPRPRPERVHDLLARHLRGIREGRTGAPPEGDDDHVTTEEHR